ncbi:MAG: acyltransferase [Proteobacteria bacterium]|nr:acyltransferase [Pseudomonadota bacterium]
MAFLTREELFIIGFKKIGEKVLIDRSVIVMGAEEIEIGDNVRIDAGCIIMCLKGYLKLGHNIHIAAGVTLSCGGGISIGDNCTISFKSTLISSSDDFCGDYLIGPQNSRDLTNVTYAPIKMKNHSHVTAHCCIMPGTILSEGSVIGAMSQTRINQKISPWTFAWGNPAEEKKKRKKGVLKLLDTSPSSSKEE